MNMTAQHAIHLPEVETSSYHGVLTNLLWSDLRTTYLLLPVGNAPDESVEISIGCRAQIKVLNHSSQHPGVGLSQPLGSRLYLKLPDHVLVKK